MQITKEIEGTVTVLRVRDAMVVDELPHLEKAVSECIQARALKIVLDLGAVPFIDSAGLEMLQDLTTEVGKHSGHIVVSELNDVCRDIFASTRTEAIIPVVASRDEAVRNLL